MSEACADRIRFTLGHRSGELTFTTFEFTDDKMCPDAPEQLCKYMLGRPLTNVDLRVIEQLTCPNGLACFAKIAAVVREHQESFVRGTD